jgi:hypothetical protein
MEGRMIVTNPTDPEKIENIDGRKGNGGKRAGSGRKKGVPNKVQLDLRKAAQEYTEAALQTLVAIATDEKAPPAARVAAATAILDRAHGKPVQAIEGTGEGGAISLQIITGVPRADDNDSGKG